VALSWPIVLAVLCGALLHAGWNVLVKSGRDKELDTALLTLLGATVALPLLAFTGPPPSESWPYLAATLTLHLGYYTALAGAYEHGELGLTYPIMRGLAPLLVALTSSALLVEVPRPLAWVGITSIAFGVGLVGLAHPGETLHHRRALAFALANAGIIAGYTVVDGLGVRAATEAGGSPWQYVLMLNALDALPYPALVLLRRLRAGSGAAAYLRQRWPVGLLGSAASLGSYAIALWAMTRAPVASVAALRETSVLFAALIGVLLLGERFGLQRALGTLVIVAGVMALRLA
jgi:phosphonate utilization associated putative membrane protein